MNEDGHAFDIFGFGLYPCLESRACACANAGCSGLRFSSCCYGDSLSGSVELETATSELIIGPLVLEKDDLTECLAAKLEADRSFHDSGFAGYLAASVDLAFAIGTSDHKARFADRWGNRMPV
jgi:hypothetical protein